MKGKNENNGALPHGRDRSGRDLRSEGSRPRPLLREDVVRIDQEILSLLLKRYNLLEKMRTNGKLPVADEKFIREKWQASATRISKDADLSSRFFAMMQDVSFLPRPSHQENGASARPKDVTSSAFGLAPAKGSINIRLAPPCDSIQSRAWIYMGAASGETVAITPAPQNSPVDDCIRAFEQLGAKFPKMENMVAEDRVKVLTAPPMGRPDRVLYAGDSDFNFFLLLSHYLGYPSRVKISGDTSLKLADYASLRRLLPSLGARMVHVVPKSNGLPVRVECSGELPAGVDIPADIPAGFAMSLLLAAPFYEKPFAINLDAHPRKAEILSRSLPILENSGAVFSVDAFAINLEPAAVHMPAQPLLPMSPEIAAFLLAMAAPCGGNVSLSGFTAEWPGANSLFEIEMSLGIPLRKDGKSTSSSLAEPLKVFPENVPPLSGRRDITDAEAALVACISATVALNGGKVKLPPVMQSLEKAQDFFHATGLEMDGEGNLGKCESDENRIVWNAPSACWALALGVAALARRDKRGFQLGNPGIIRELWSPFWKFYNGLALPEKGKPAPGPEAPGRRRIMTSVVAVPPEIREEDWD